MYIRLVEFLLYETVCMPIFFYLLKLFYLYIWEVLSILSLMKYHYLSEYIQFEKIVNSNGKGKMVSHLRHFF
ncbi:hypothetical protein NV64_18825 [Erwinia sp. B116]|nr:hypothetical protein NV64_18825 [Erwinia sp. B116]